MPSLLSPVSRHARWNLCRLKADDAWGLTDEDRTWCRDTMSKLRSDGFFTPPSLRGTLVVPGNVGGMAWGGIAHDRVNSLLIMPVNNLAAEVHLIPRDKVDAEHKAGRRRLRVRAAAGDSLRPRAAPAARSASASAVHAPTVGHARGGQSRNG